MTDAPWVVDQAFLDLHKIDYVAHDEEPYVSTDSDDIYRFLKDQGQFLPTRRTAGVQSILSPLTARRGLDQRIACAHRGALQAGRLCVRFSDVLIA